METGYQRGKIQEESLLYERRKHDGSYPIIGVNTFRNPHGNAVAQDIQLARSTGQEKESQLERLAQFHERNRAESAEWLAKLRQAVIEDRNVFEVLMDAVRCCSLGEISNALYDVGGRYRRSM
jgi:methylmalonyl-CoA mutase